MQSTEDLSNENSLEEYLYSDLQQNEQYIKNTKSKLSIKGSLYFIAALEDNIKQLLILRECSKYLKLKIIKETDNYLSENQLEKIDLAELASDNHKIAKMNSDRDQITEIIIKLYLDIKINKSFASLLINLADITAKTYQLMAQELQHNENRNNLKSLQKEIQNETRLNKSILENCDLQIHKLKDEINNEKCNCKIKQEYVADWQNARIDQHKMRILETEKSISDNLNDIKIKIDQETRINQEIEKFINISIKKFMQKVECWKRKYVEESEKIDNDIKNMKVNREIQDVKIDEIEKLIADRQKEIDDWLKFVEERNQRIEREQLLQKSATSIQAWWRGVMVRRRLAAKQAKESKRKSAKKKK